MFSTQQTTENKIKANAVFFQPKFTVNQSGDAYEREADHAAERVMAMPVDVFNKTPFFKPAANTIQRKCQACEEEETHVHRKESPGNSQTIHARIDAPVADTGNADAVQQNGNDQPQTLPTTQITANSSPNCTPQGVMIDVYLSQSGDTDKSLGVTNLNRSDVNVPGVNLLNGILQKTTAGFQATSFFLLPQIFKDKGSLSLQETGDINNNSCPKGTYPKYLNITQSGSDTIRDGENEHCSDFKLAFDLSLAKFRDAINSTTQTFGSDAQAKSSLQQQTGVHPDKWGDNFWCLASKSKERDTQNWHSPKFVRARVDQSCQKAVANINPGNLPEIGKHPSTEIIKDCDTKKAVNTK